MVHALVKEMKTKNVRALAKAITLVENDHPAKLELLNDLYPLQKSTHYIGITGSPGAGKSTLVDRLVTQIRNEGQTVAIIAVDPTSPFSGGALLGDRVRMSQHFADDGVFIRSMATRGSLGGLARATKDAIRVCGAYGFDVVIVETVGVGQSELDIMKVVDSTAVVLTPNSGDVLQIFKAGIMEIADLFVINKADIQGVTKLKRLLKEPVTLAHTEERITPIIKTVATENKGIDELWDQFKEHEQYMSRSVEGEKRRDMQHELEVCELIRDEIWRDVETYINDHREQFELTKDVPPYQMAMDWYEKWKKDVKNI